MKVNREKLLNELDAVAAGLSKREVIDQSNHFIFRDGRVMTFNDEVACSAPTSFDPHGDPVAVIAAPLLALLRKLTESELEVEIGEEELTVKGKGRRAGLRLATEVLLPVDAVEVPTEWHKLPKNLLTAIGVARSCVSSDESIHVLTYVHFTPKWLESTDDFQVIRYKIKTGLDANMLLRGQSLRVVDGMDATEWGWTENWMHFRNASDLIVSCRQCVQLYPDLTKYLQKEKGVEITLPEGLAEAVEKAWIFSKEDVVVPQVMIELTAGRLKLTSRGPFGWYSEKRKFVYEGDGLSFAIAPRLLLEIDKRSKTCTIASGKMFVDGGDYFYVSCLNKATD